MAKDDVRLLPVEQSEFRGFPLEEMALKGEKE
jgi:hypothetical protein